jgi:glycosyltransferase involved in cell wall biosynthesis
MVASVSVNDSASVAVESQPVPGMVQGQSRRLKVLFFYQDFGQMGGIERWLLQTADLLKRLGNFEPVVVCCKATPLYDALQKANVTVYGIDSHPFFARSILRSFDFFSFRQLKTILDREKPDLVHVQIGLGENRRLQHLGYPVVYSVHGYSTLYSLAGVRSPLKRAFKRQVRQWFRDTVEQMDAVLFVSEAERQRMRGEGFISRDDLGEVLPNGVDLAYLAAEAGEADVDTLKANLGIPVSSRCVSFIGRLDSNRNPLAFIETARCLSKCAEFSDVHFLLAGDGELMPAVQAAAVNLPNLHVLGYRSDVPALLAVSDLVISCARLEGFGLGLLEAMSVGVPCLAVSSGGATGLLDGSGLSACLVESDAPESLSVAAARLLNMSADEKKTLVQALKARAADFDQDGFAKRLSSVYHRLLPTVSVILPVYQGEATVLHAVQSVLSQTYRNLELIVVDDGSTDGTLDVLQSVNDPRLKILQQQNQGVAVARNFAFTQASGEYIAFIDADDIWLSHKLAAEISVIRPQLVRECIVYSSYYAVDEEDRLVNLPSIRLDAGDLSEQALAEESIFLPSTSLVHRQVFERTGGFKPACYHEDRVFFVEACRAFPAYPTGKRLVLYQQSLSGRCRRILNDYETALSAELSIVETLRPLLSEAETNLLEIRQRRNLMFRFLMYGYQVSARKLAQSLQGADLPEGVYSGKKGLLVKISLRSGVNCLVIVRRCVQALYRSLAAPVWFLMLKGWERQAFQQRQNLMPD